MKRPRPIRSNSPKRRAKQAPRMWKTVLGMILLVVVLLSGLITGLLRLQRALDQRRQARGRADLSAPTPASARQVPRNGTGP